MRTLLALVAAGAGGALGGCLPGDVAAFFQPNKGEAQELV